MLIWSAFFQWAASTNNRNMNTDRHWQDWTHSKINIWLHYLAQRLQIYHLPPDYMIRHSYRQVPHEWHKLGLLLSNWNYMDNNMLHQQNVTKPKHHDKHTHLQKYKVNRSYQTLNMCYIRARQTVRNVSNNFDKATSHVLQKMQYFVLAIQRTIKASHIRIRTNLHTSSEIFPTQER